MKQILTARLSLLIPLIFFIFLSLFFVTPVKALPAGSDCDSDGQCDPYTSPNRCSGNSVVNDKYRGVCINGKCSNDIDVPNYTHTENCSCGCSNGACNGCCDPKNGQECETYGCCADGVEAQCYKQYNCDGECVYAGYRNKGSYCGNNACSCNETHDSCPADCPAGPTPPPTGPTPAPTPPPTGGPTPTPTPYCKVDNWSVTPSIPLPNSSITVKVHGVSDSNNWQNVHLRRDGTVLSSSPSIGNPNPTFTFSGVNAGAAGDHTLSFTTGNGSLVCSGTKDYIAGIPTGTISANPTLGHIPSFSPVINGLSGKYYSGISFNTYVQTKTDATIYFNDATTLDQYASPDGVLPDGENFSVRWSGYFKPAYTGTYTFYTLTDDGVRLYVSNKLVWTPNNYWKNQAATEHSGSVYLYANEYYPIRMDYFQNTGGAVAKLYYSCSACSPVVNKAIIPSSRLFVTRPNEGLNVIYYDNASSIYDNGDIEIVTQTGNNFTGTSSSRVSPQIDYDWSTSIPANTPDTNMTASTWWSARWTGYIRPTFTENYTFYVTANDGFKLYVNDMDNPLIDRWSYSPNESSGTISLTGGQVYRIKLEFYQATGTAFLHLFWSSPHITKQIIPKTQLFRINPNTAYSTITWNGSLLTDPIVCLNSGSGYYQWAANSPGSQYSYVGNGGNNTYGLFNNGDDGCIGTPLDTANVQADCPLLSTTTNLTPSGTLYTPGLTKLNWNSVSGILKYGVSVNDLTTSASLTDQTTTNSYNYNFQSGHSYQWCIDTYNVCGLRKTPAPCVNLVVLTPPPNLPWIQTTGDVHSNENINTSGGP